MGSAKLPEQINDRVEEALRNAGQKLDPTIERSRAQPVDRKIGPEEVNVRRPLSPGATKGTRTIAYKIAIKRQLQSVYDKIDRLRSGDMTLFSDKTKLDAQIVTLRRTVGELRKKLAGKKSSTKGKRTKRRRGL